MPNAHKSTSKTGPEKVEVTDKPVDSVQPPVSVPGDAPAVDENAPYKDAAAAKEALGTEATYGQKRADGEVEGVTVNVDQYNGAKFDKVREAYVKEQRAQA